MLRPKRFFLLRWGGDGLAAQLPLRRRARAGARNLRRRAAAGERATLARLPRVALLRRPRLAGGGDAPKYSLSQTS